MFTRIDHIAINVKEIDKVSQFYQNIFGFGALLETIIPSGKKIVYLKLSDTILEISETNQNDIKGSHFCLHTDNFEQDYNYLISLGIEVFQKVHPTAPRTHNEIAWRRAVFVGIAGEHIEIRG